MSEIPEQYRSQTEEQFFAHLCEELNEAATACAKALRFGALSVNPELPPSEQESNFVWLRREMKDVFRAYAALGQFLADEGHLESGELIGDMIEVR